MKKTYTVETIVTVEVDESKFTPEFLHSFSSAITPLDDVDEHMGSLAEAFAIGQISGYPKEFVEGYGELESMGIVLKRECTDTFED